MSEERPIFSCVSTSWGHMMTSQNAAKRLQGFPAKSQRGSLKRSIYIHAVFQGYISIVFFQ